MATKKNAKKSTPKSIEPKLTPEEKALADAQVLATSLELFETQQYTGIVMAQGIARRVFGDGADRDVKLVLRIQELLLWEENGDPAEDQDEVTKRLEYARDKAAAWFSANVAPHEVLDLHGVIHEDFFGGEDEEEDEEEDEDDE